MSRRKFPESNISKDYVYELFESLRREIVYDPDYGLSEDEDFYEKLKKDATVEFLLRYRSQLVAGNKDEWDVKPYDDGSRPDRQAAKIMKALLRRINRFQSARYNLARAFLRGNTWAYGHHQLENVTIPGYGRNKWFVFKYLQDIDKRRFDQRRHPETKKFGWYLAVGLDQGGPVWSKVNPLFFVQHKYHDTEDSIGHGKGVSAALYFSQWFKAEAMKNGMQFINRWSQGLVVYTLDALAASATTADARGEDALTMLDNIRAGNNIVVPNTDDVKVIDAPQGGWSTALEAINYIDTQMSRLILASVINTGGGDDSVGSLARAQVEDTAMARLIGFDRNLLAETLTNRLIKPLWIVNRPLFVMAGLGDANMPVFSLETDNHIEPETMMEIVKNAFETFPALKQMVSVEDFARIAKIPLITDDDEVETMASLEQKYNKKMAEQQQQNMQNGMNNQLMGGMNPGDRSDALEALFKKRLN